MWGRRYDFELGTHKKPSGEGGYLTWYLSRGCTSRMYEAEARTQTESEHMHSRGTIRRR